MPDRLVLGLGIYIELLLVFDMVSSFYAVGLVLSVIGGVLDFVSGYMILQTAGMFMLGDVEMMGVGIQATTWVLLLFVLGVLLLVTGVLGVTRAAMGRMHVFGGLMVVYGVVMLFIGFSMLMGLAVMMMATPSGVAMLIVGLGMIINGLLMIRRQRVM